MGVRGRNGSAWWEARGGWPAHREEVRAPAGKKGVFGTRWGGVGEEQGGAAVRGGGVRRGGRAPRTSAATGRTRAIGPPRVGPHAGALREAWRRAPVGPRAPIGPAASAAARLCEEARGDRPPTTRSECGRGHTQAWEGGRAARPGVSAAFRPQIDVPRHPRVGCDGARNSWPMSGRPQGWASPL